MKIGTENTYTVKIEVCSKCQNVIGDTGLCGWQCPLDGELAKYRSKGLTKIRTYKRTDVLISEEIE
jgi:hypothetical protein